MQMQIKIEKMKALTPNPRKAKLRYSDEWKRKRQALRRAKQLLQEIENNA